MPQEIVVSNERFELVKINPDILEHCTFLAELWNTPLYIQMCGKTPVRTAEDAKAVIENRFQKEHERNGYGTYIVFLKDSGENPNPMVGTVALNKGDSPTSYSTPDLGFVTLPQYARRGIASDASRLLLEYARKDLGVEDVFGFCDPGNSASRRTLERCGLEFRGIRKLTAFGGVEGTVYVTPTMDKSLESYGL